MPIGKALLRIGEVAKLSGVSTRTIDYYTQCGLLTVERSPSNYRLYAEETLHTIERIKMLKSRRFSIDEIKDMLQKTGSSAVDPLLYDVQDDIECLEKKLSALEECLKTSTPEEKQQARRLIEKRLAGVTALLAML